MVGIAYGTVGTSRYPSAIGTHQVGREPPAVLEQYHLFTVAEGLCNGIEQTPGEMRGGLPFPCREAGIGDDHLRHQHLTVAGHQLSQPVPAGRGIIVALQRGRGGTEQRLPPVYS